MGHRRRIDGSSGPRLAQAVIACNIAPTPFLPEWTYSCEIKLRRRHEARFATTPERFLCKASPKKPPGQRSASREAQLRAQWGNLPHPTHGWWQAESRSVADVRSFIATWP
jgi:hypothetical protein